MQINDLREFISEVERLGECRVVKGADWEEIGIITEVAAKSPKSPLALFDEIKGYKAGYRVASNLFTTPARAALGLGLPVEARGMELLKAFRDRERKAKPLPPVAVKDAPVRENVHQGDEVDLFEFPTPKWHEHDGGRFIGTGCFTILRDPDEGWINLAPQRVQIHDKNIATIMMAPYGHGGIIRRKYWDRGMPCPVAVSCGQDPLLWFASCRRVPWGVSEYDFAGALKGQPIGVIYGPSTGLPIPATAEIVLEGEIILPGGETKEEGPFGEWLGYYARPPVAEPVFRIKSILHRNDPIIQGNPPSVLPPIMRGGWHIEKAALLWEELDRQLPGIKGVWMLDTDSCQSIPVISLKQEFAGHAKQAGMVAVGTSEVISYCACKYIILVDEDIDPTNVSEVIWALATRTDPAVSIDIVRGLMASVTDPMLSPEQRKHQELSHSVAVINACKPYSWIKEFPRACAASPELLNKTREKWGKLFE